MLKLNLTPTQAFPRLPRRKRHKLDIHVQRFLGLIPRAIIFGHFCCKLFKCFLARARWQTCKLFNWFVFARVCYLCQYVIILLVSLLKHISNTLTIYLQEFIKYVVLKHFRGDFYIKDFLPFSLTMTC